MDSSIAVSNVRLQDGLLLGDVVVNKHFSGTISLALQDPQVATHVEALTRLLVRQAEQTGLDWGRAVLDSRGQVHRQRRRGQRAQGAADAATQLAQPA
jgi:hypothetical protein